MEFTQLIAQRYSCKNFGTGKVDAAALHTILEAGRLAPTAKNTQEQRIYVIQSEEGLAKIDAAPPCRYGAPVCLVVAYDKNHTFTYPGERMNSGMEDAAIVATHLLLGAANAGVDSCWVNFFDPDKLAKALGLPENEEIVIWATLPRVQVPCRTTAPASLCPKPSPSCNHHRDAKKPLHAGFFGQHAGACVLFQFSVLRVDDIPPIQVSTLQAVDEHLRGGDVGGQRDVMHITQAQQGHLVGLAGLCVDRIAEEQEQIDLIAGNAGCDLLITALNTCQKALDLQTRCLGDQLAGGTRSHQFMLAQNPAIRRTELNHQLFFGVMRNQCNRHRSTSPLFRQWAFFLHIS